ncbi:MAG: hypothetical protein F4017_05370 [Acidimicrobiaceae bacterium]|nr:hypothetical protein [Acidimicrobiaceae bacterium]MYE74804.1 hypothetical protein [Acidimicrobiaceae bacterium]MYH43376.1 hypothetical protein [Acidimicrobiaceae bacterium]MYJ40873.1 hypothetical protein [Acidimicrobiaceae bacterium]MYK74010.1 hypothetical protein [Acidimicrobiaceae bacterium]
MSTARAPEHAVAERATSVHHFEIETEGADLLDWEMIDALYEAGCSDATIRHRSVEFDREAPTLAEAIESAVNDIETVIGVTVKGVRHL